MKNVFRFLSVFLIVSFLGSCQSPVDPVDPVDPVVETKTMTLAMSMPAVPAGLVEKVEVKISGPSGELSAPVQTTFDPVVFKDIKVGDYTVEITATGKERGISAVYFSGTGPVTLSSAKTSFTIPLNPIKVLGIQSSLLGGTVAQGQKVTLSTATTGAKIYYTLDGTAPTKASIDYSVTVPVLNTLGQVNIRAKAFHDTLTASVEYQEIFNVTSDLVAAPVFSPLSGTFENSVALTLTHSDNNAKIYYTIDGTTPTALSNLYSQAIQITTPGITKVQAIAVLNGKTSSVATENYTVTTPQPIQPVVITPTDGTIYVDTLINLSCATSGVTIYFTTDGTEPLASVTHKTYSTPFTYPLGGALVVKAIAVKGNDTSVISSRSYNVIPHTVKVEAPTILPAAQGIYNTTAITMSTATAGADIYYTTNNSTPTTASTKYSGSFNLNVGNSQVIKAIAVKASMTDSDVTSKVYDVTQNNDPFQLPTPIINPGLITVTKTQPITLTCADGAASIYYTLDGTTPTAASTKYTAAFTLSEGQVTLTAIAIKTGSTDSPVNSRTFTVTPGYTGGIKVHTLGYSNIHYWNILPASAGTATTWPGKTMSDEGKWKTATLTGVTSVSIVFNNPGQTSDLTRNVQGEWWYYNNQWYAYDPLPPNTPEIKTSLEPGKYGETQTVTLTSSEADDVIYYTTDGAIPTSSSPVFSSALNISTMTTVKAFGKNRLGITGPVVSFTYDVNLNYDLVVPVVVPVKRPGNWRATSLDVSFTLKDNKSAIAKAYYTTDGTAPTTSSPLYVSGDASGTTGLTGPVWAISGKKTIKFLAVDGANNSNVYSFTYNVDPNVRVDFREETIYFLMTTRFYDGDASNNFNCWGEVDLNNPASDPAWRGDFKGLVEKLDYIKALGFSAIWVTPPVKNLSGLDYHGYHAVNFKKIDPRYKAAGDISADEAYQKFIQAAHDRGMKVVQDIVLNHSSNFGEENLFPLYEKDASGSYKNSSVAANMIPNAAYLAAAGRLAAAQGKTVEYILSTQPYPARLEALKTVAGDPNWLYKHGQQTSWNTWSQQDGDMAGDCRELNTENYTTASYLMEAMDQYIGWGVDAFRIDTVKHISRTTFNNFFLPHFKQTGGEGFYMFGECANIYSSVWDNGIPAQSTPHYTWKESKTYPWSSNPADWAINMQTTKDHWEDNKSTGGQPSSLNHLLDGNNYRTVDYSKSSGLSMIDFCMHHNFGNAGAAFGIKQYDDTYNDATWNVVYVDSHDYGPNNDGGLTLRFNGSEAALAENMSLMFTFRGIPTIYYGTEVQFQKGKQIEPWGNGRVPFADSGRAYFGDKITGNVTATDFGKYTASGNAATALNHNVAQHIRRLNMIRRAVPALQKGQYSTTDVDGGIAYKKRFTDAITDSFALIAVSGTATFSKLPAGTYTDAISGDVKTIAEGGSITATVSGQGNLRVYVLSTAKTPAPGQVGNDSTYQAASVKFMN